MSIQLIRKTAVFLILKRCVPVSFNRNRCYSGKTNSKFGLIRITSEALPFDPDIPKTIAVEGPQNIIPVLGVPEEHVKGRLVRIYRTPKNAMQSGTNNVGKWELEYDTRERWENPLMGWSSTGDPHSNLKIQFSDQQSAVNFAEKRGYNWYIEPEKPERAKVKSYGFNFSWNKRTRVTTK